METGAGGDLARVGAAMARLERRIEELAAAIERQEDKLDRQIALAMLGKPSKARSRASCWPGWSGSRLTTASCSSVSARRWNGEVHDQ